MCVPDQNTIKEAAKDKEFVEWIRVQLKEKGKNIRCPHGAYGYQDMPCSGNRQKGTTCNKLFGKGEGCPCEVNEDLVRETLQKIVNVHDSQKEEILGAGDVLEIKGGEIVMIQALSTSEVILVSLTIPGLHYGYSFKVSGFRSIKASEIPYNFRKLGTFGNLYKKVEKV